MPAEQYGRLAAKALQKSNFQKRSGKKISVQLLLADLKACGRTLDLQRGKKLHAEAVARGQDSNIYVQSTLVRMYAKCGSIVDARRVFDSIEKPNVVSWSALLLGYAENGEGLAALDMFSRMKSSGCPPDSVTYLAALKACTSLAVDSGKEKCLEWGREIHSEIGSNLDQYVQNSLIDMYAKCRSMVDARHVFNNIQKPDVVSWTALILGYAENGDGLVALDMFSRMEASGCVPNSITYVAALKACSSLAVNADGNGKKKYLERGRNIHLEIRSNLDLYLQSTLIDMYAKCCSIVDARYVFDCIQKPDVVCWNALLLGYAENGEGRIALDMFSMMKASGCVPNSITYVAAVKACTSLAADGDCNRKKSCLVQGREIHSEIGGNLDLPVQNTLIEMYAKCGSIFEARRVFDFIQKPDLVCWNALLLGYAENGEGRTALDMFSRMKASGCLPNSITYVAALKACTSLGMDENASGKNNCLEWGRKIHLEIGKNLDLYIQSTLIDMYAKCGSIDDARCVFDSIDKPDVVCWNNLLLAYAESGEGHVALDMFCRMKGSGCEPDSVTYVAALKACSLIGALDLGRKLHSEITEFSAHVVTCLVDFYGKCGSMIEAQKVFDLHPKGRDFKTWIALLAGYGRFGDSASVFNVFEAMQGQGFRPDAVTFVCMLSCCSHAGLVEKAREYFEAMDVQYGVTPDVMHYSCMVDVLGRANLLNEAIVLLQKMPCGPDAVTWMALLGACCKWKNVDIGRMAFQSLVCRNEKVASAHVLMANIHGWMEQVPALETGRKVEARKLQGQAYVLNEVEAMVRFVDKEKRKQLCKYLDDYKKQ